MGFAYYPFGMTMPGRTFSAGTSYRYGFNGKENDKDAGEGIQDYGMRIYSERLGKFLSVDPITAKYPELTPYQFASNTPIQATDLDGLEAFFVHGTDSKPERWTISVDHGKNDNTLVLGLTKLTNNKYYNTSFSWNVEVQKGFHRAPAETEPNMVNINRTTNDASDRKIAATLLTDHIIQVRKDNGIDTYDDKGNLTKVGDEPITLIGHSHGGNVSIQAASMIFAKLGKQVDLITIATPAYNTAGNVENPKGNPAIRKILNIYNTIDGVSGGLAGDDYYTIGPSIKNLERIKVDASKNYSSWQWLNAHSYDANHPDNFLQDVNADTSKDFLKK
jgi:RHS repeat-associated protein